MKINTVFKVQARIFMISGVRIRGKFTKTYSDSETIRVEFFS
jgi:hypothetical protein